MNIDNQFVADAAKAHAERCYPLESCGIVVGDKYIACDNIAENPENQFKIARKVLSKHKNKVQAVIHSHCDHAYYPSKTDMQGQIDSQVPWGIVFVRKGTARNPFYWGDSLPITELIGRRFQHGITDCYSLVRDYYRLNNIVTLPEVPRDWEWWKHDGFNLYEENFEPFGFKVIDPSQVREGDAFIAQIGRTKVCNHAGVYVGNGLILHQLTGSLAYNETSLSVREPFNRWIKYIRYWVRYQP